MFDERFARQYRYEPPSEFPLSLPFTGIVHHLSGPNRYARTQTFHQRIMVGRCCCLRLASLTFIMRVGFSTSTLAYMLDSLVRVSRRVGKNHFGKIAQSILRHYAHRQSWTELRRAPSPASLCGYNTSFCLTVKTPQSNKHVQQQVFDVLYHRNTRVEHFVINRE